jgi:hypothetical protein
VLAKRINRAHDVPAKALNILAQFRYSHGGNFECYGVWVRTTHPSFESQGTWGNRCMGQRIDRGAAYTKYLSHQRNLPPMLHDSPVLVKEL